MKVLLTGAAGFIGSSLAERLIARGDVVVGLDNFDRTLYAPEIKRRNLVGLLAGPRFQFVEGDFLDEGVCDELVSGRGAITATSPSPSPSTSTITTTSTTTSTWGAGAPDVIVHLGALAGVRPSLEQPKRYQRVNIEGTLNLLEAARQHGVRRFVFASSSSVYGARSREEAVAFSEDDPAVRPASPYAATKRAGELLCSNYSDLYGIATPSLRFFTVYGPRQRPEMAIHKFARLIAEGRPVPFYGDGQSARDYTYIDDIVDGVVASIDHSERMVGTAEAHRVYNLGGSRTTTLARLVELLEAALGKRALLDRQPDQAGDVPITFADVRRAAADLGYAPKVPIEEGIVRFVRWFEEQRRG